MTTCQHHLVRRYFVFCCCFSWWSVISFLLTIKKQTNKSECFFLFYTSVPAPELLDAKNKEPLHLWPPGGAHKTVWQMGGDPGEPPFSWETHVIPQLRLLSFVLSKGLEVSGPFWKARLHICPGTENLQHMQASWWRCICLELLLAPLMSVSINKIGKILSLWFPYKAEESCD